MLTVSLLSCWRKIDYRIVLYKSDTKSFILSHKNYAPKRCLTCGGISLLFYLIEAVSIYASVRVTVTVALCQRISPSIFLQPRCSVSVTVSFSVKPERYDALI